MTKEQDRNYDRATERNDHRGTIPEAAVTTTQDEDTSTDDNALDDAHDADEIEATIHPNRDDGGDVNQHDNEAEWSETDVP